MVVGVLSAAGGEQQKKCGHAEKPDGLGQHCLLAGKAPSLADNPARAEDARTERGARGQPACGSTAIGQPLDVGSEERGVVPYRMGTGRRPA